MVEGIDLFERFGVGIVLHDVLQHRDRAVERLEEVHIALFLRIVRVLRLAEMQHGQRAVDIAHAMKRHDFQDISHSEDVVAEQTVGVGVLQLQPSGHDIGERLAERYVAPIAAVQRINLGVGAAVPVVRTGHIAGVYVADQVISFLITVVGIGIRAAARVDGVHLHGGDEHLQIHILRSIGVGIEALEVPGAGGERQTGGRQRKESLFDIVSFHSRLSFRIGVLH